MSAIFTTILGYPFHPVTSVYLVRAGDFVQISDGNPSDVRSISDLSVLEIPVSRDIDPVHFAIDDEVERKQVRLVKMPPKESFAHTDGASNRWYWLINAFVCEVAEVVFTHKDMPPVTIRDEPDLQATVTINQLHSEQFFAHF
jgi:hypothetical protein